MSPMPAASGASKKDSGLARTLGSATAGIAELTVFHSVDTVAKRLMSNKTSVKDQGFNKVVFREFASASAGRKFLSLFPGIGYAAGYKITQRIYKYAGQPYVNDYLNANYRGSFVGIFGEKNGKAMMQATAGSIIGIGEIWLLPLDRLKIIRQTNPEVLQGRGLFKLIADEGLGLYKGAGWTAARNAPGSFALFGASAATKDFMGITDYSKATWTQNFIASIAGSVASIGISQPIDLIKTRIQNQDFKTGTGGVVIIKDLIKNEGFSAFFKGFVPKVLVVGPKLVFSFTVAQSMIPMFTNMVRCVSLNGARLIVQNLDRVYDDLQQSQGNTSHGRRTCTVFFIVCSTTACLLVTFLSVLSRLTYALCTSFNGARSEMSLSLVRVLGRFVFKDIEASQARKVYSSLCFAALDDGLHLLFECLEIFL
ncbi:uncharacterized protein L969DRAFT_92502 [Mixia osmundae IAM 14324]|uniref:Mitochondrial carrier protein n=1 Tax=Mixia osmundae (strain CBS 9802 / IAM 14324 / JCM 22182 / KY 12970) TaxID=764103 RepID=G7DXC5_MIXOS|nr:uncharacterized protein L969DRAFT_92502 [Mixia osmundae IAM 14324]KEI41271.1 hypothetical protein L969DRAFT_92502 [Mixia osmundae IAM 14324]GAA95235.1 hypothetical protein E5Q_01891 [Mixia osmundae IAM 14324]